MAALGVRNSAVLGIALAVFSCAQSSSVLQPAGPVAAANRTILLNALTIMLAIVVPTIIATIAFAWWFRAGDTRARYQPEFVYSGRIEMVVWSIPILVILFLGGVIWVGSHELDPCRPLPSRVRPLEMQVVSLDWKWLFIYPEEGIATVNQLAVPVGVPVHFTLTSATVMNAFFVPRLGSIRAYARLARPEVGKAQLFGAVQPRLFDAIVSQHVLPAPPPDAGALGARSRDFAQAGGRPCSVSSTGPRSRLASRSRLRQALRSSW